MVLDIFLKRCTNNIKKTKKKIKFKLSNFIMILNYENIKLPFYEWIIISSAESSTNATIIYSAANNNYESING